MRELTYWNQIGALFMLEDLTLLQRNILGMIAGTKNRGLNFHDYEIAHQFKATKGAITAAIKVLRKKDYITDKKRKSPHRILYASEKTKTIIKEALQKAKSDKNKNSTTINGIPVENSTGINGIPVTGINGIPLLAVHSYQYNRNKEIKENNSANAQGEEDKSSSVAPSESNYNCLRPD